MHSPSASFIVALTLATTAGIGHSTEVSRAITRGLEGAVPIPFVAANEGPGHIACTAAMAHWFSVDLGEAAPGEAVEATLWFDPKTGEIALLNDAQDRVPVQALWCGVAGRSWATRSAVALPRRAGETPAPIKLACAPNSVRLICR